jgi:hypothetical protein
MLRGGLVDNPRGSRSLTRKDSSRRYQKIASLSLSFYTSSTRLRLSSSSPTHQLKDDGDVEANIGRCLSDIPHVSMTPLKWLVVGVEVNFEEFPTRLGRVVFHRPSARRTSVDLSLAC